MQLDAKQAACGTAAAQLSPLSLMKVGWMLGSNLSKMGKPVVPTLPYSYCLLSPLTVAPSSMTPLPISVMF